MIGFTSLDGLIPPFTFSPWPWPIHLIPLPTIHGQIESDVAVDDEMPAFDPDFTTIED